MNMEYMFVTCAVFHDPMSWLNASAPSNMSAMSVTCAVFHEPMSWLNAAGAIEHGHHVRDLRGIPRSDVLVERFGTHEHAPMSVTCAVFHDPMSWLNASAL